MHTLPSLPYSYDALEPHIDAQTMEIHYTKHHQTYVDKLNAALEKYPDLQTKSLEELMIGLNDIPEDVRVLVRNHGGGHLNHSLFWNWMKPQSESGQPSGELSELINQQLGGFENFQKEFANVAAGRFGSGWAWLVLGKTKHLMVMSTANQDNPLIEGYHPLLGLDVWEHAYYLKYQNKRPDYINAWWQIVNWGAVQQSYDQTLQQIG